MPILDVILEQSSSELTALAPQVGAFSAAVRPGELVQAGQRLGELSVLNRRVTVRVPADSPPLRVVRLAHEVRDAPVGYRDLLIGLEPAALGDASAQSAFVPGAAGQADRDALGLPPEAIAVRAPVDGQFYGRPSPDDPPFVSQGDVIGHGQVVGLVEVMKFFYEVPFEAPDPAARYEVVRLVAKEGTALGSGDAIAWVVPESKP